LLASVCVIQLAACSLRLLCGRRFQHLMWFTAGPRRCAS
jgi:hypothetical protein